MSKEGCTDLLTLGFGLVLWALAQTYIIDEIPELTIREKHCIVYHEDAPVNLRCTER